MSEKLLTMIAETRQRGYAFSDGLIAEGVRGVGVCVVSPSGEALAALSVAGISQRFRGARLDNAARVLLDQKNAAEAIVRSQGRVRQQQDGAMRQRS